MVAMNKFTINYAPSLLAATPERQLVSAATPKKIKGISREQLELMERESANLEREVRLVEDSYGADHLDLVLTRGDRRRRRTVGRIKRGDGEDGDPVGAHHAGPDARQVSRKSARVSRYRGTRRQLLAETPHHNEPRTSLKRFYVKRSLVEWRPFSGTSMKGCLADFAALCRCSYCSRSISSHLRQAFCCAAAHVAEELLEPRPEATNLFLPFAAA
ncbi:MAG: plasmid partitioning protein RepB C-terminal domain-containing protein [Pseudomonadota bacterium]